MLPEGWTEKCDTPGHVIARFLDYESSLLEVFIRAATVDQRSHSQGSMNAILVFFVYVRAEIQQHSKESARG